MWLGSPEPMAEMAGLRGGSSTPHTPSCCWAAARPLHTSLLFPACSVLACPCPSARDCSVRVPPNQRHQSASLPMTCSRINHQMLAGHEGLLTALCERAFPRGRRDASPGDAEQPDQPGVASDAQVRGCHVCGHL